MNKNFKTRLLALSSVSMSMILSGCVTASMALYDHPREQKLVGQVDCALQNNADKFECVNGFAPKSKSAVSLHGSIKQSNVANKNPVLNSFEDFDSGILTAFKQGSLESLTLNYDVFANCDHYVNITGNEFKNCLKYYNPFAKLDNSLAKPNHAINFKIVLGKNVKSTAFLFAYIKNFNSVPLFDTKHVTNMKNMFFGSSIEKIPSFDVGSVTTMRSMFQDSMVKETPALNSKNVTDMSYMFKGAKQLEKIGTLDTRNVTNMEAMFWGAKKLTSVPKMDTSKVTSNSYMFKDSGLE